MEENGEKVKTQKRRMFAIIITLAIIAILFIAIYILMIFVFPKYYIDRIEISYENKEYTETAKYFNKLSNIKEYLKDNTDEYEKIEQKVEIAYGIKKFEDRKFKEALEILEKVQIKDEEVNKKINESHYELGKELLENKKYEDALTHFEVVKDKEDINNLLDEAYYYAALDYFENKNYAQASYVIEKVKNKAYENLNNMKSQIHYEFGKQYFEGQEYDKALQQFKLANNYEESQKYINKCAMVEAEQAIENGEANKASKLYNSIADDTEYNGIKASDRKKQLKKYKALINVSGKWKATKEFKESRHVWRYDGSYDNWYNKTAESNTILSVNTYIDKKGKVTLKIKAQFYAFNNYSSIGAYCNSYLTTRSKEIKNITTIPSSIRLDSNTKLLYSNGKFSLKYSKKDEYSANFYNLYNSSVTYGKKIETY